MAIVELEEVMERKRERQRDRETEKERERSISLKMSHYPSTFKEEIKIENKTKLCALENSI